LWVYEEGIDLWITGKDGAYLAKFLLAKGDDIHGGSQDVTAT